MPPKPENNRMGGFSILLKLPRRVWGKQVHPLGRGRLRLHVRAFSGIWKHFGE